MHVTSLIPLTELSKNGRCIPIFLEQIIFLLPVILISVQIYDREAEIYGKVYVVQCPIVT